LRDSRLVHFNFTYHLLSPHLSSFFCFATQDHTLSMRGELCIGTASFLSLVAVLLLIFIHVGQINTSSVPRGISMVNVNVSRYGAALAASFAPDPIQNLYTNNATAPLGDGAGLRQLYKFGLYNYCAFVLDGQGTCTNHTIANRFHPYIALTADMSANYSFYTDNIILNTTFRDSNYLGKESHSAYYLLLLGAVCAAISLLTGVIKHTWAFFLSTGSAVLSSILVLSGSAIWTVIIQKSQSVQNILAGPPGGRVPVGIVVSTGPGLYLAWASFACLVVSIVPYMISCCTFRG